MPEPEEAPRDWTFDQNGDGVSVNGKSAKEIGKRLLSKANNRLPADQGVQLKFCYEVLEDFQMRMGLECRPLQRKRSSADAQEAEDFLLEIRQKLSQYSAKNQRNANELGTYCCIAPECTPCEVPQSSLKMYTSKITELACSNADGSEKASLMFIGGLCKPRPFGADSGREHGLDYYASSEALMMQLLFMKWLERFNLYIVCNPGQIVIRYVKNCSAHGTATSPPSSSIVEVQFLPLKATNRIQPMDGRVVAAFKAAHCSRMICRIFDNVDVSAKSVYSFDILTAMKWL